MRRTKWNALAFLFSGALILAACGAQPGDSASEPAGSEPAGSEPAASEPAGEGTGTITMVVDGQITQCRTRLPTFRLVRPTASSAPACTSTIPR